MSQQINLYHPIFRQQEKKFSAMAMVQASGLMVLGVVLLYAYLYWQVQSLHAAVKQADARQVLAAKRFQEVAQRFGVGPDVITRLEQEIAMRQRVQAMLQQGNFGNTRGFSDYLLAFSRQHMAGVWLTGFDIVGTGERLTLQGRSTVPERVPQYIQRLSAEKPLAGVEFQIFQIGKPESRPKDGTRYVEFLVGTAPAGAGKP